MVAAAAEGRQGTNALYLRPPGDFSLHFGDASLPKFAEEARLRGRRFIVHEDPSLALDLDEPSDLVGLAPARADRVNLELRGVEGLPEIHPGDDLAALIVERSGSLAERRRGRGCPEGGLQGRGADSHALGGDAVRARRSRWRRSSMRIRAWSRWSSTRRTRIVRDDRVLIVETHQGFVCANAGVDRSNVDGADDVCLLPIDCDASALAAPGADRIADGRAASGWS